MPQVQPNREAARRRGCPHPGRRLACRPVPSDSEPPAPPSSGCPTPPPPPREDAAFDAWLRVALAGLHAEALEEPVPEPLLRVLRPPA